jgi:type I restriction enzyme R subunit
VIFTTIQEFSPAAGEIAYPVLPNRRNIVVIADEAHRSQYGFQAKVAQSTGEIPYGFAEYLRDGLPKASFIGFTGTPIEKDDVNTPAVFGDNIDIYDISRAVEDGATVPISKRVALHASSFPVRRSRRSTPRSRS